MRPLLTPELMGVADRATIESGTPAETLMDRAGRAVARAAIRIVGGRYGRRAVVVCGPGSNGGDGFVAARALRREGMAVRCLLVDDAPPECAAKSHFARLASEGIAAEPFQPQHMTDADVIVDAIFGTGFRGTAQGAAATAIEAVNASGAPVVSVDIPSGVVGATGHVEGPTVSADVTVAIAAEKIGTALP
ncbi:MAG: NAD(P)H-hydrate epimerase, partial [Actinomycetota bacterium]